MNRPNNNRVSLIVLGLVFLAILVIPEALIDRHPHFAVEKTPLFFPLLGFSAVVVLALLAKLLKAILGRKEGHYDD